MITKFPRNNNGYYDLRVTDRNDKSFVMTVGGNLDLYWIPENHKETRVFEIDEKDKFTFSMFNKLFKDIKKNDNKYYPVLKDDTVTFVSEDWPEDEANILQIEKQDGIFSIRFIKNENIENWSFPHRGCSICFCNSGSRVPKVESVFMKMFNELAYESDKVSLEEPDDENIM